MNRPPQDAEVAWRQLMAHIISHGEPVSPRQQPTREVLHTNFITVDMLHPVVTSPERKINYGFMAAEALWILDGNNELAPLTRFIKRMANFSDDGETLAGAYGPRILPQLKYVVDKLVEDRDTRQAVLTIWTPNPDPSKDVPCTVSMAFSIRNNELHQHVYMRSSDAWLGIPYDIFSFTCVGLRVACLHNRQQQERPVYPGQLTISMTSSHLYDRNLEAALQVLEKPLGNLTPAVPHEIIVDGAWEHLYGDLVDWREGREPIYWQLHKRVKR